MPNAIETASGFTVQNGVIFRFQGSFRGWDIRRWNLYEHEIVFDHQDAEWSVVSETFVDLERFPGQTFRLLDVVCVDPYCIFLLSREEKLPAYLVVQNIRVDKSRLDIGQVEKFFHQRSVAVGNIIFDRVTKKSKIAVFKSFKISSKEGKSADK